MNTSNQQADLSLKMSSALSSTLPSDTPDVERVLTTHAPSVRKTRVRSPRVSTASDRQWFTSASGRLRSLWNVLAASSATARVFTSTGTIVIGTVRLRLGVLFSIDRIEKPSLNFR